MNEMFRYGEQLRKIRKERGLSQEQIALSAEITPAYYGLIERGQANPSVSLLEQICGALNVPISDIFINSASELPNIDKVSLQIIYQLYGKSEKEKEIVLNVIRQMFALQKLESQKSEKEE